MTSQRDSCCRKHFNEEWMWSLVTNRQQIKRFVVRHYRHQVAPELQQHNHVCLTTLVSFCSSFNLVLFLFVSFLLYLYVFPLYFHLVPFFLCLYFVLSLTTSCYSSHPPSVSFSLSFLLSWFCAHAPPLKSSGESHCGKFPAHRLLCGSLVSQHRCWGSNLLYLWHLCSTQQLRTKTQSPMMRTNYKSGLLSSVCFCFPLGITTSKSQADTFSFTVITIVLLWSVQLLLLKFILKVFTGWCQYLISKLFYSEHLHSYLR